MSATPRRRLRGPATALLGLLFAAGSGPAGAPVAAGEPGAAFRPLSAAEWVGEDGRHRLLYEPQFLPAPALLADAGRFGLEGVDLALDAVRGRVLFTAEERRMGGVREALGFLDAPPPQAMVHVAIVETLRRHRREGGGHGLFDRDAAGSPPDGFFRGVRYDFEPDAWLRSTLSSGMPFEGSSVAFGNPTSSSALSELVLRSLAHEGCARFVADPVLLCTQGVPASMSSVIDLPETVFAATGTTVVGTIRTEPAGVRLEVTAERVGTDHVALLVHPWIRQVVPAGPDAGPTATPVLAVREAVTRLVVPDGETVLVAALGTLTGIRDRRGLPLLDRLPSLDPLPSLLASRDEGSEVEVLILAGVRILRPGRAAAPCVPPGEAGRLTAAGNPAPRRSRARLK